MRQLPALLLLCGLLVAGALCTPVAAQDVDILRGRVTGLDSIPIARARVTALALSTQLRRTTLTDTKGRYTLTVPNGDGDYFVTVIAMGFAPRRFEVKRVADEVVLIGDAMLGPAVTTLEAVQITGGRKRVPRDKGEPDVGGSELPVDADAVLAAQGDLAAMAASVPGLHLVPGTDGDPSGFSALGLGADQNAMTLNGGPYGGGNLPLDARVTSAVALSPYDVARGGFSGAQMTLRTAPGTNYRRRTGSAVLDAPSLQWMDRTARAWGQAQTRGTLGEGLAGPLVVDAAYYSVAYQIGRRTHPTRTLLNADPSVMGAAGVAADSVRRLLQILPATGVDRGRASAVATTDDAAFIGAFDFAPPASLAGTAYNVTLTGNGARQTPLGLSPTTLPSAGADQSRWTLGALVRHSTYFAFGLLSESTVGASGTGTRLTPWTTAPAGRVLVASTFAAADPSIAVLGFGGGLSARATRSETVAATNALSWFTDDNRHRIKLTTELRREGFRQASAVNTAGLFTFTSLADLAAGRAASFSRQMATPTLGGSAWTGALALGDAYRPTKNVQLQLGVRLDGTRFDETPTANSLVDSLWHMRNDGVPQPFAISPRIGFSWVYGKSARLPGFDGAMRAPRAVVRGGVGVFQGSPSATLLSSARTTTGLADGTQQVTCIGDAVPVPTWGAYADDPATVPTQCLGGGGAYTARAPNVALVAREFQAPRSLRANLQWTGATLGNRLLLTADATYSETRHRAGTVDLNFAPRTAFVLAAEQGRPVFVTPAHIVPATGALAITDAQVTPQFNRVLVMQSDLQSRAHQITLSIAPLVPHAPWTWSLSYVYAGLRAADRGFSTNTAGAPDRVEWARAPYDARHQLRYTLSYDWFDLLRTTWQGTLESGLPWTPMVGADINGDGLANDRAFIPDPASTPDLALAEGMRHVLGSVPAAVRACLRRQMGTIARRGSCEGPWAQNATLTATLNPLKLHLPPRANLSFQISNPLGAADLLLHGDQHLRGWGQAPLPDPVLLAVRGFDPATQRFRYDVNPRVGSTNLAYSTLRSPVTVTMLLRIDLGPTREAQTLTRALDRGRAIQGQKMQASAVRMMLDAQLTNPLTYILSQSEDLALDPDLADTLAARNRRLVDQLHAIWDPLVVPMVTLADDYDHAALYASYRTARERAVDLLATAAPGTRALLTSAQWRRLPPYIQNMLDLRYLRAIRSATVGDPSALPMFFF